MAAASQLGHPAPGLGVIAALAAGQHASAATEVVAVSEPLSLDAEQIYHSLPDADATAASAFLSGGLEPAAARQRYNADIKQAAIRIEAASAPDSLAQNAPVPTRRTRTPWPGPASAREPARRPCSSRPRSSRRSWCRRSSLSCSYRQHRLLVAVHGARHGRQIARRGPQQFAGLGIPGGQVRIFGGAKPGSLRLVGV
jgi:hypothetical protein